MHAHEQARVVVRFYDTLNSPLVKRDVLPRRNRHEAVRQIRYRIDFRQQFPLVPPVIMFGSGQCERFLRLREGKRVVPQFAGKMAREHRVIRLPN
jgi:hypothetical protein